MPAAADEFFPQVYGELRRLAAAKMAGEAPGHTLDATALVHEAFLKLGGEQSFASRSDFFRAAAEAMRRILVDSARARKADKRGGELQRVSLPDLPAAFDDKLEALTELETHDAIAAELVKLRYFSGVSHGDAASLLGLSRRQADGLWSLARAWLFQYLRDGSASYS